MRHIVRDVREHIEEGESVRITLESGVSYTAEVLEVNDFDDTYRLLKEDGSEVSNSLNSRRTKIEFLDKEVGRQTKMQPDTVFPTPSSEPAKPRTFMTKLNNYMKLGLSPQYQKLVKAGFINGDLLPTQEGQEALLAILFAAHLDQLEAVADEKLAEDKKSKSKKGED